jgi:hypothetical protein
MEAAPRLTRRVISPDESDDWARNPIAATSPEIRRRSHAPVIPSHCCIVREFGVSIQITRRKTHFNSFLFFFVVRFGVGGLWEVCA